MCFRLGLFLQSKFPGAEGVICVYFLPWNCQSPGKKKPKKPVWVCYFSVRDACSEGDVSVHLLVSCKQNRNFWECLKLLSCCGWGLTDNHCQAFTQHSKVTFPLILMSSVHIQALEWEFKGMLTFKSTQSSSLCKGLSGQGWSLWLELQLPVRW